MRIEDSSYEACRTFSVNTYDEDPLLTDGHVCGFGIVYDIVGAFFGGEFFPTPVSTDFEGGRLLKKQMKMTVPSSPFPRLMSIVC